MRINPVSLCSVNTPLDEHEDKVFSHTSRLRQLLEKLEKVSEKTPETIITEGLLNRLRDVLREVTLLDDTINSVALGPDTDACLLR